MILNLFGYVWILIIICLWLWWTGVSIKDGIEYLKMKRLKLNIKGVGVLFIGWAVINGFILFLLSLWAFCTTHPEYLW